MEIEILSIDDKNYGIFKEIKRNDINYLYLVNINDEEDIVIRKSIHNNPNTVIPLEDKNEYNKALLLFLNSELQ